MLTNPEIRCLYTSGYTAEKPFSMRELAEKVRDVLEG